MPGIATLTAEVANASKHCFWLLLDDEELVIPFSAFPWFRAVTIEQLAEVERPRENHLYWPVLDVDLSVESIRTPENFPLVSRIGRCKIRRPDPSSVSPGPTPSDWWLDHHERRP